MFKPAIVFAFLAALAGGLMACSAPATTPRTPAASDSLM